MITLDNNAMFVVFFPVFFTIGWLVGYLYRWIKPFKQNIDNQEISLPKEGEMDTQGKPRNYLMFLVREYWVGLFRLWIVLTVISFSIGFYNNFNYKEYSYIKISHDNFIENLKNELDNSYCQQADIFYIEGSKSAVVLSKNHEKINCPALKKYFEFIGQEEATKRKLNISDLTEEILVFDLSYMQQQQIIILLTNSLTKAIPVVLKAWLFALVTLLIALSIRWVALGFTKR